MFYRGYGYYYNQHHKNLQSGANAQRTARLVAIARTVPVNPDLWVLARLGGVVSVVMIGVALVLSLGCHA